MKSTTLATAVLVLALAGCGAALGDVSSSAATSTTSVPSATDQSPSPSEPRGLPSPTAGGTPAAVGSDVTGGDGAEPAPASDLSTRIGQDVSFRAVLTEVMGVGAVGVTAEQGGPDPVLVYGRGAPAGADVGSGVDVVGSVEVFDAAGARASLGPDVVPAGLERFDGTPAVLAG